jgi:simple sugar transport system permease protein
MDWGFLLILSTPLILAALGEVVGQKSGVLNIGLEGMMLMGAFAGYWVAIKGNSPYLALAVGIGVGGLLSLISAYFTVKLGSDQVVVGTAVNFLALGLTGLGYRRAFGEPSQLPAMPEFASLGPIDAVTATTLLLIPILWVAINRTKWGLALRACGEYPKAVEASGFSVHRIRMTALLIGGLLAGLAGAYLSVGVARSFAEGMTAGRGFLAIALVTFGRWHPAWTAVAALVLGYTQSLQYSLQGRPIFGVQVPSQLWLALPYVAALAVLVLVGSGSASPGALGRPYEKEG